MSVTVAESQRVRIVDETRVQVYDDARVRVLGGDVVVYGSDGGTPAATTVGGLAAMAAFGYMPDGVLTVTNGDGPEDPSAFTDVSVFSGGTDGLNQVLDGVLRIDPSLASSEADCKSIIFLGDPTQASVDHGLYTLGARFAMGFGPYSDPGGVPVGACAYSGFTLLGPGYAGWRFEVQAVATETGMKTRRAIFPVASGGAEDLDNPIYDSGLLAYPADGWPNPPSNTDGDSGNYSAGMYWMEHMSSGAWELFFAGESLDSGTGFFDQGEATLLALISGQRGLGGVPPIINFYVPMVGLAVGRPDMNLLTFGPVLPPSGGGGGTGDVVGPSSSVDNRPALFDGTTGKLLKQASAALGTAAFAASTDFLGATAGAGGALSGNYPNPGLNEESVQDLVGAMFSGNTETGIAATYDDTNGKIDLAVSTQTVDLVSNVAADRMLGRVTSGSGDSEELTASQVRTLLGLVIGTNVQAWDAELDALAALATTSFGRARLTEASGWVPLSDTLVSNGGSGVASISVSCSGYRHLRLRFKGRSLRTAVNSDVLNVTVNSDTNNRYSVNGGSLVAAWAIGAFTSSKTNTDRMGSTSIEIDCGNSSWTAFRAHTATVNSESTLSTTIGSIAGIYNQTTAITSVQVAFASANIADGSSLIVEGWA